jgi:energy-coupling factor transporter transmembrane protein EcfT
MRVIDDDGVGVGTFMTFMMMMNLITIATRTTTTEDGVEAARRFRKVNVGTVMMTVVVVVRRIPTGLGLGRR